jgi:16S rRNA processing protein RimM
VSISEEFIPVGEISGAFGVRGWMKIYSFTDPRDNILRYSPLYISLKGEWVEAKVVGGQVQGKGIVMGLANVTDRDQVIALVGSKLAIKKSQLAPAEDGEFYWSDLIGLNVVNNQ